MEEGVALARVAVPPEMVNVKSLDSNAPLPPDVLFTASLNVTAMLALFEATVVPVIVDAVRSTINVVNVSVTLSPTAASVDVELFDAILTLLNVGTVFNVTVLLDCDVDAALPIAS